VLLPGRAKEWADIKEAELILIPTGNIKLQICNFKEEYLIYVIRVHL
jgi:hypothetical protein